MFWAWSSAIADGPAHGKRDEKAGQPCWAARFFIPGRKGLASNFLVPVRLQTFRRKADRGLDIQSARLPHNVRSVSRSKLDRDPVLADAFVPEILDRVTVGSFERASFHGQDFNLSFCHEFGFNLASTFAGTRPEK